MAALLAYFKLNMYGVFIRETVMNESLLSLRVSSFTTHFGSILGNLVRALNELN